MPKTKGTPKKRRIALVGTASSRALVPVNDLSWEIWGVGGRDACIKRADRWFEMHNLQGAPTTWAENWRKEIRKWSHECQLVMLYPESLGPNVMRYPHERIVARFGTYFMQSTFSWMMALAIDELAPPGTLAAPGVAEIGLWGVDMEYGTEYREQRMGFRHFIDMARVLRIEITRLATSGLAYEPVPYPLIQDDPLLSKLSMRTRESRKAIDQNDEAIRKTRTLLAQNEALFQELNRMNAGNGYDSGARLEELKKEQAQLMKTSATLSKNLVAAESAWQEQQWCLDYLRP